jgi:signal peptidase
MAEQGMEQRKKAAWGWRVLWARLAALIVALSVYRLAAGGLTGASLPMPFGYGAAVVNTATMEPALSRNDLVVVHREEDIQVDDVVVYQNDGALVVHRVVALDGDELVTQGDANEQTDLPVQRDEVQGVVVAVVPRVGAVVQAVKSPTGVILILVVLFAGMELSFRRTRRRDDQTLAQLREEVEKLKAQEAEGAEKAGN